MFEQLDGLVASKYRSDELIVFRAMSRLLAQEYQEQRLPTPTWLSETIDGIQSELANRTTTEKRQRLARLRARRAAMGTLPEKRIGLDREIDELTAELEK